VKANRTRFAVRLLAVVAVATVAAGCSDNAKVGTGVNTDIKSAIKDQRLGETTTTAAPAAGAPKQVGIASPTTTAKPVATTVTTRPPQVTTTTAAPKAQDFVVNINGDKSGKTQFEPTQVSVYVGTPIKFVNTDSVTRSVKSGDGAAAQFQSPDIPPGGSWVYVPDTAGTIPIVDGTRPYATGTLYVSAR
jgi:plastocyanin